MVSAYLVPDSVLDDRRKQSTYIAFSHEESYKGLLFKFIISFFQIPSMINFSLLSFSSWLSHSISTVLTLQRSNFWVTTYLYCFILQSLVPILSKVLRKKSKPIAYMYGCIYIWTCGYICTHTLRTGSGYYGGWEV